MTTHEENLLDGLRKIAARAVAGATGIENLHRLSGGASQEMWSLDAATPEGAAPLVLRRAHGTAAPDQQPGGTKVTLETEAKLLGLAAEAGVPVPRVPYVFAPEDDLGTGFMMERIEGETIARKILRDDEYAEARPRLARQCGEIVAKIHTIDKARVPELEYAPASVQLENYREMYDNYDHPHPVFELAFKWLSDRMIDTPETTVVHGDFRNGNMIIGPDGVRAVLDWELAHIGDPMEDLSWISVNSWRFGSIDLPVGGFGLREDLFEGYESAGGIVDRDRVRFWEIFGSLKWGIMCMTMYFVYRSGLDPSVERAAIGRRSSETEVDLMNLLTGDA